MVVPRFFYSVALISPGRLNTPFDVKKKKKKVTISSHSEQTRFQFSGQVHRCLRHRKSPGILGGSTSARLATISASDLHRSKHTGGGGGRRATTVAGVSLTAKGRLQEETKVCVVKAKQDHSQERINLKRE